jgi:hydroxypyruvate reductase
MEKERHEVDLSAFRRILVRARARPRPAWPGHRGDPRRPGFRRLHRDQVRPRRTLERIEVLEAGIPCPTRTGVRAARKIADLADQDEADTLVVTLISGGGSPRPALPLEIETDGGNASPDPGGQAAGHRELWPAARTSSEINCLRKHLSGLKGGRLLQRLVPGAELQLHSSSDVVGDHLDTHRLGHHGHDRSTLRPGRGRSSTSTAWNARVSPKIMHVLRWDWPDASGHG